MSKQTFKKFYSIARTVAAGNVRIVLDDNHYVISSVQSLDMYVACGQPVQSNEFEAVLKSLAARKQADFIMLTAAERLAADLYQCD